MILLFRLLVTLLLPSFKRRLEPFGTSTSISTCPELVVRFGALMIRSRRSLMPFERFTLRSRVVTWDEKWFYFEHAIGNARWIEAESLR